MAPVSVVWFKRDLRLSDHHALATAIEQGRPVLMIYIAEPALLHDPHYSERHWRFIRQSLQDMNRRLKPLQTQVHKCKGDVLTVLADIHQRYGIGALFSHEETGLDVTYRRDRAVAQWCRQQGITWQESPNYGVVRGLSHRRGWDQHWFKAMQANCVEPDWQGFQPAKVDLTQWAWPWPQDWPQRHPLMQIGGEVQAWATLNSFLEYRGLEYVAGLSSPDRSRDSCSRLSPYLAWGNISMRQVFQTLQAHRGRPGWAKTLRAFESRLHWQSHFIQKFESEPRMEFEPVNRGFAELKYRTDHQAMADLEAWRTGQTGYPMIDASMRAVMETGYLNFRMRAMLVSFLTHHLWLDWRLGVTHLAQQFLDFEPGIHYAQFQMQAGHTGLNTVRVYNPIKQGEEKDPQARFIRQWIPELAPLPKELCHKPWMLPPLDAQLYDFVLGRDYPEPIVDIEHAAAKAREQLWAHRDNPVVRQEQSRILARHVRPNS